MNWNQLYGLRSYVRSSLWVAPFVAIPFNMVASRLLHWLDPLLGWTFMGFAVPGAQAVLQAIVTANLSFVVFTFGSLLVAIQVASAQLTPRIIATTLLRNNVVFLAALLGITSFAAFFYLIDYAARLLRPISILALVGDDGLAVIESVYPDPSLGPYTPEGESHKLGSPNRIIQHQGTSGIILAVNLKRLITKAESLDGVIEFVPQIGDFVAVDEPLFNLYGGASLIDDEMLRASVALGSERTMEQDPTFAFRIVVDIALRALSAAINDPTTAVLAIDQLHRMLRMVGKRHLRTDEISDKSGQLRLVFRTPNWEDYVHLAFSEIRSCGSNNLQIVRRLRAMIQNLLQTLPAHRHPALHQELSLLEREIAKHFAYPEELALAAIADAQGLGGHSGKRVATSA
jgi:uncharacterized membrane protein